MTDEEAESSSREIIGRLIRLPEYTLSRCAMLYWSCGNEVRTHELVRRALGEGKRVVLPRCETEEGEIYPHEVKELSRDLEKGAFGILEPGEETPEVVELSEIELCVVPGMAFDREGNRIGRGLGYYDRFLRKLSEKTEKVGLAYTFQIVDKIYTTDRDARVDKIVTTKGILVAGQ